MKLLAALCIASLPLAAFAAGTFTLESLEVKPGAKIAEAQVFKGFGCEGGGCASRGDHGHLSPHQIGRQSRKSVVVILRPAVFDGDILVLDVASFA